MYLAQVKYRALHLDQVLEARPPVFNSRKRIYVHTARGKPNRYYKQQT